MKLRQFLATVPMAAVALALPAKAVEREPTSSFRGWDFKVDPVKQEAWFFSTERTADNDWWKNEHHFHDSDPEMFRAQVSIECRLLEQWACRLGSHPMFLPP